MEFIRVLFRSTELDDRTAVQGREIPVFQVGQENQPSRGIKPHLHQHIVKSLFVLTAAEDGNPAIPALLHPAKGQFQHAFESLPRVTLERKTTKISIAKQSQDRQSNRLNSSH